MATSKTSHCVRPACTAFPLSPVYALACLREKAAALTATTLQMVNNSPTHRETPAAIVGNLHHFVIADAGVASIKTSLHFKQLEYGPFRRWERMRMRV